MLATYKVGPYIIRDISFKYPHIYEIIEGQYDNIFELLEGMTFTYIYGGILRDIIAGMPMVGDLDILISKSSQIKTYFDKNPRWVQKIENEQQLKEALSKYDLKKKTSSINSLVSFINTSGYEAQVITYSGNFKDEDELLLTLIESLDFICCGFVMKPDGTILEIIEGAVEDCLQRIIRVNPYYKKTFEKARFEERKNKLEARGWQFVGNMDDIQFEPEKKSSSKSKVRSTTEPIQHTPQSVQNACGEEDIITSAKDKLIDSLKKQTIFGEQHEVEENEPEGPIKYFGTVFPKDTSEIDAPVDEMFTNKYTGTFNMENERNTFDKEIKEKNPYLKYYTESIDFDKKEKETLRGKQSKKKEKQIREKEWAQKAINEAVSQVQSYKSYKTGIGREIGVPEKMISFSHKYSYPYDKRVYCDICEIFDEHESEKNSKTDGPKELKELKKKQEN